MTHLTFLRAPSLLLSRLAGGFRGLIGLEAVLA